eukprot:jgi/Galph1/2798/GphlegSOOS_G1457.1
MEPLSSEFCELEHPLQKHPLNFTSVKTSQGNAYYSLTETETLDFKLDACPQSFESQMAKSSLLELSLLNSGQEKRDDPSLVGDEDIRGDTNCMENSEQAPLVSSSSVHSRPTDEMNLTDPLQAQVSNWDISDDDLSGDKLERKNRRNLEVANSLPVIFDSYNNSNECSGWIKVEQKNESKTGNIFVIKRMRHKMDEETQKDSTVSNVSDNGGNGAIEKKEKESGTVDSSQVCFVRTAPDFALLDKFLREYYRFVILPYLITDNLSSKFYYRGLSADAVQKEYERYLRRLQHHPVLKESEEFLSFVGLNKDGKSWSAYCNDRLSNDEKSRGHAAYVLGKEFANWVREQASEATKELRKGVSLVFESSRAKDTDSQDSVEARIEKIKRYLKHLEDGLLVASKLIQQYTNRRDSYYKVSKALDSSFLELSSHEGSKMKDLFKAVSLCFSKDVCNDSENAECENHLGTVLQEYSFLARDARRIVGERLAAHEAYENALEKYNQVARKVDNSTNQLDNHEASVENDKSKQSNGVETMVEQLSRCRDLYEKAAFTTDSELRRFRLEYHMEMNQALYRLAYERWKWHMEAGKTWEHVFKLCDKHYKFLQQQAII